MSEKKKQHFVPRLYLKNFSLNNDRRSIGIFTIESEEYIGHGNLRNQAYVDFFYGKGKKIENAFEALESSIAKLLLQIFSEYKLPVKNTTAYFHLLTFVISLSLRTRYAADFINEAVDQIFKMTYKEDYRISKYLDDFKVVTKDASRLALSTLDRSLLLSLDLSYKLIINKSRHVFITSDNPVVKHNQFFRTDYTRSHLGFASKGLQILLPLNPLTCLILFDADVYRVGNRKEFEIMTTNSNDIDEINSFQYINADKVLYFNHAIDEDYIRRIIKGSKGLRRKSKVVTHEYEVPEAEPNTKRSIIHTHPDFIRKDLKLSFVKILKKAKKYYPESVLDFFRDPELVQQILEDKRS